MQMDNRSFREIETGRILIIKLSALGDVVQALPVLYCLRKTWPGCTVDWVTGEAGANLLEGHPLLNRVIVYPRNMLGHMASNPLRWPGLMGELSRLGMDLRKGCYDCALDIQGLFKSGLITFLSGAREKVGFSGGREGSSFFLNRRLPKYDPDQHAVLRYLSAAEYIGADTSEIRFPLGLKEADFQRALELLKSVGVRPGRFVLFIPGTVWPSKHWTTEGFSVLARIVAERLGLSCVVAGAGSDSALGKAIEQGSGGAARDITGRTSLKVFASLSTMAATAVSTDTGPMHLAAAAGLRVVALFGPTSPGRTGPFGKGHVVLNKEMACSPCFKRNCSSRKCMLAISPDEAAEAVEKIITNTNN